jgi:apolipoprotein N-acyltransferase
VTGTNKGYHNSAVTIGEAEGQYYHKSHLVPFGEAVPMGFRWFLSLANIPMSDFTPGELAQAVISIRGINAAINICYEYRLVW